MVKNPPANEGDTGGIPDPGRSHMHVSFDDQRVKLNLYIYGNGFSKSLDRQGQTEMSAWGIELTICGEE